MHHTGPRPPRQALAVMAPPPTRSIIPPPVQAYIDGIPPGHRPLFDRIHRLILQAQPGAEVTLS